uniref:Ribosomal protein L8 n=1 Tax=Monodon monoceros TaxID=40151 RepID=A0A8C6ANB5_MONMO
MGRMIPGQRKGAGSVFHVCVNHQKGITCLQADIVKDIIRDPGCCVPLAKVVFQDPYRFKKWMELFIAAEGIHTGQFVYYGKNAQLNIGNMLLVDTMPDGTIVYCLEEKPGDWGMLARASGNYVIVISHNPETKKTRVKLPLGSKKVISSINRVVDTVPWHVGSSRTGARTRVPCIGRRTLNHCATREAPAFFLTSLLEYNLFKMVC